MTKREADDCAAMLAAFDSLDVQRGYNHVSLVALRERCQMDRDRFDVTLRYLRWQRILTMSAAEGRHGISAEERAAGIVEDGMLLLYVSIRHQR